MLGGKSIAAAADAVSRNGLRNMVIATSILIFGRGMCYCIKWFINKNELKQKYDQARDLEDLKHNNRVEEEKLKHKHKKELSEDRNNLRRREPSFSSDIEDGTKMGEASVETYDEVVAGKDIPVDDLRLGLRCFHLGEDCGLIGRTQIGKTSWALQYSIALAKGSQEDYARLTDDWSLSNPMTVLYFAFEQDGTFFKAKYGKGYKSIPNLYIEVKTSADDFNAIRQKIKKMQSTIGCRRLLVVFDNITKMKCASGKDKRAFFEWLENYRNECALKNTPITYLKVYHTQGHYKDYMPLEATTNYGTKTDTFFTQSLVGFGMCKDGNGRLRYIKELKNKFEQDGEKQSLSIFRFADSEVPMYDYEGEADECDVLPLKADLVRGKDSCEDLQIKLKKTSCKRGPKEIYNKAELLEIHDELQAGFTWKEVLEGHNIKYDRNKTKGIKKAFKRYGIGQ